MTIRGKKMKIKQENFIVFLYTLAFVYEIYVAIKRTERL